MSRSVCEDLFENILCVMSAILYNIIKDNLLWKYASVCEETHQSARMFRNAECGMYRICSCLRNDQVILSVKCVAGSDGTDMITQFCCSFHQPSIIMSHRPAKCSPLILSVSVLCFLYFLLFLTVLSLFQVHHLPSLCPSSCMITCPALMCFTCVSLSHLLCASVLCLPTLCASLS